MSSEWNEYATSWDDDRDVIRYSEMAYRSLSEVVPVDGQRVLDFGCGTGSLTERIAPAARTVVGLDTSPAMLEVLEGKQIANVDTVADELTTELVLQNRHLSAAFDLIVASSVCGFLPDYEGTLAILRSLLEDGGIFVQWDWCSSDDDQGSGLVPEAVRGALEGAGFESVSVSTPFAMASPNGSRTVLMGVGRNP